MTKRIFLLLSFGLLSNLILAQVEINNSGILGIGYIIDNAGGFPIAKNVLPGSPAFIAGVTGEDRLLKINDQSLSGITLEGLTEKFKVAPGASIKILLEHPDKTQQEVVLKKAGFISASYKVYKYMIFFDENKNAMSKPDSKCVWGFQDCYNGMGYYVYSPEEAFYGEYENGNRKDGLYYYIVDGKPSYYLGEFVNNKFSGKGTWSYTSNAGVHYVYSGNLSNGEFNGYGKKTDANGKLVYEGFFKNGLYEGYGILTANEGSKKEGRFLRGDYIGPMPGETLDSYDPGLDDYEESDQSDYPKVYDSEIEEITKKAVAYNRAKALADSLEMAAIMAKSNKYLDDLHQQALQQAAANNSQSSSGSSSSSSTLDFAAAQYLQLSQSDGWFLKESFDVNFARNSIGSCFTSCSERVRSIFVFVEDNVSCTVTAMDVSLVQRSNDIRDLEKHPVPFNKIDVVDGIAIFNCQVTSPEVRSGCSYNWGIVSDDPTSHRAKVLVLGK